MDLFSSWPADQLAYFTWHHAGLLLFALLGGLGFLFYYANIQSSGGMRMDNWEWRTNAGTHVRQATLGEVYAYTHKGRSYRSMVTRTRFVLSLLFALLAVAFGMVYVQMVGDDSVAPGYAWAQGYPIVILGGLNAEVLPKACMSALAAALVGIRMMFGIGRWIRVSRMRKQQQLRGAGRACLGLSKVDFVLSIVFLLLLAYPIARALLCVFGPDAATASLPDAYYDGTLLKWQLYASAAYLSWACVQSVIRAVLWLLHRFD